MAIERAEDGDRKAETTAFELASMKAASEAFGDVFHKIRTEVSRDWFGRIWDMAVNWMVERNGARALHAEHLLGVEKAKFKNFHRVLCERFGYAHDDADWRRDQVSLIEHIAKLVDSRREQDGLDILHDHLKPHDYDAPEIVERYMGGLRASARMIESPLDEAKLWLIDANVRAFYRWLVREMQGSVMSPWKPGETTGYTGDDTAESIAACLGDDAAILRGFYANCELPPEIADNMDDAARLLSYAPLSLVEVVDLTTMIWGAPVSLSVARDIIVPTLQVYEAVRAMGKRPIDVAKMPPDYWDSGDRPEHGLAAPAARGGHGGIAPEHREEETWYDWNGARLNPESDGPAVWPTCPVYKDTMLTVRFRDGEQRRTNDPLLMRWAWSRPYVSQADIVAFKIESPF